MEEKKKDFPKPSVVQEDPLSVVVVRVGSTRIIWTNFAKICSIMKREQTHVSNYFEKKLRTTGSVMSQGQLIIKGQFVPRHIESLLKKYFHEYVNCKMCNGVDTRLNIYTGERTTILTCESCGNSRAVEYV